MANDKEKSNGNWQKHANGMGGAVSGIMFVILGFTLAYIDSQGKQLTQLISFQASQIEGIMGGIASDDNREREDNAKFATLSTEIIAVRERLVRLEKWVEKLRDQKNEKGGT